MTVPLLAAYSPPWFSVAPHCSRFALLLRLFVVCTAFLPEHPKRVGDLRRTALERVPGRQTVLRHLLERVMRLEVIVLLYTSLLPPVASDAAAWHSDG